MTDSPTETKSNVCIATLLSACRPFRGLDPRGVMDAIDDPRWDDAGPINDWRNRVGDTIVDIWDDLPVEARLVAYFKASVDAFFEDAE